MARRPRTGGAVATAHQGRRPQSGLRHLLRLAVALGGGPVDGLLLRPLRLLWRALPSLRSKNARRASAAAAMARRNWRDHAPPRATSLLRRAVARAGGAVGAALLPGRRALAVLHRAFAVLHRPLAALHELSPSRALLVVRGWLRRLLRPRRPRRRQGQRAEMPPPPPPSPRRNALACIYGRLPRPSPATSPATSPPPAPPPPRRTFTVDGVVVPEGIVDNYADYCHRASKCPASNVICNFCFFEIQRAPRFRVPRYAMPYHCQQFHLDDDDSIGIRCEEAGCSVRVRPGDDQALHIYFCHRLPPDWWTESSST